MQTLLLMLNGSGSSSANESEKSVILSKQEAQNFILQGPVKDMIFFIKFEASDASICWQSPPILIFKLIRGQCNIWQ